MRLAWALCYVHLLVALWQGNNYAGWRELLARRNSQ